MNLLTDRSSQRDYFIYLICMHELDERSEKLGDSQRKKVIFMSIPRKRVVKKARKMSQKQRLGAAGAPVSVTHVHRNPATGALDTGDAGTDSAAAQECAAKDVFGFKLSAGGK